LAKHKILLLQFGVETISSALKHCYNHTMQLRHNKH